MNKIKIIITECLLLLTLSISAQNNSVIYGSEQLNFIPKNYISGQLPAVQPNPIIIPNNPIQLPPRIPNPDIIPNGPIVNSPIILQPFLVLKFAKERIERKYNDYKSLLGDPVSEIIEKDGNFFQYYTNGCIYDLTDLEFKCTVAILGAIYNKWNDLGREKYGFPSCLDEQSINIPYWGQGKHQYFYSSLSRITIKEIVLSSKGAYNLQGAIRERWYGAGGYFGYEVRDMLGYPTTDEIALPRGGRYTIFQGGVIYWSPSTGAWELFGAIREKWNSLGAENSFLGLPISAEETLSDGIGKLKRFEKGTIIWTPATGAWEIHGAIRDKWFSLGAEDSSIGYPISDEIDTPDKKGRMNFFQHGAIIWTPEKGAYIGTPPSPPNKPNTIIGVILEPKDGYYSKLQVNGSYFEPNEIVTLNYEITDINGNHISAGETSIQADKYGSFTSHLSVVCGAQGSYYTFTAIGNLRKLKSNSASQFCQD